MLPFVSSIKNFLVRGGQVITLDQRIKADPYYRPAGPTSTVESPFRPSTNAFAFTKNRGLIAYLQDVRKHILFQFNPTKIDDVKEVSYEDRSRLGTDNADYIWIQGGGRTMSFELFLDATESSRQPHMGKVGSPNFLSSSEYDTHSPRGVLPQVEFFQSLQRPYTPDSPRFIRGGIVPTDQFAAPPEIVFVYGPFYLIGVVGNLNVTYTLWDSNLIPRRALVQIAIKVRERVLAPASSDLINRARQGFNRSTL